MLCWNLWFHRDRWVWDKVASTALQAFNFAGRLLLDWQKAKANAPPIMRMMRLCYGLSLE
ncbi:conserved hypothetical protein [Ricinus communis]|uniref:Uncharacterized protein n=1 Tax=Ricinus communis TaxID=3988 RepID=B9SUM1_RICCO|nr:conserved hypothetical protein [Ricinus communis]